MDPRRLYRDIVEIEKQLRDLLRSNPLNVHDANLLRSRLTEKARQLTDVSPTFAAAREIEQVLWKPCFYKRIEDFRRRIRKYATASASDRSVREHFARVSAEFQAFLSDASTFYESLRARWTQWLVQHRVSRIASSSTAAVSMLSSSSSSAAQLSDAEAAQQVDRCRHSLHRCLVFLGDLARYRELHNQKAKKNFAAAEQFYFRALSVLPENGNPHNQLAVLATYVEAETVAVYRYCRSLLIAQPFATAEENLALLFERSRQRPLAPPMTVRLTAASPAKDKSAYLKSALHRLTRLHGALFSIASREAPQQTSNNGNANGSLPSSSPPPSGAPAPVYSKEMEALVIRDVVMLVSSGVLSDALLIKLLVINVFCVLRSAKTSVAMDALRLTVRVMTATMTCILSSLPEGSTSAVGIAAQRLLASVSAFADFLRLNPNVIERLEALMASKSEPLDINKRSVDEFLETLVKLLNHSAMQTATTQEAPRPDKLLLLKENMELRGFAPLQRLWADAPGASSKWRDDLAASSGAQGHSPTSSHSAALALSDQDAWELRVWNLRRFARYLCEEYEGNPLLYAYQGQFSTSPTVVSSFGNGNVRLTAPLPSSLPPPPPPPPAFLPMGNYRRAAAMDALSNSKDSATTFGSNSPTDDFDDEVIVYQPSASPLLPPPAPRPMEQQQPLPSHHPSSGITANPSAFSASGLSMPFSSGYAFDSTSTSSSVFGPPFGARSVSGPTTSASASTTTSSLGFPSFQSFSGLERLSTQSGLLAGWGHDSASPLHHQPQQPSVTPLAGAFSGRASFESAGNNGNSRHIFGDMDDLVAIEMESAMYRQKESSLSAILGGSASSSRSTSPYTMPPLTTRSASGPALASRPPPGFGGSGPSAAAALSPPAEHGNERRMSQQFFTRNPFVNP